MKFSKRDLFLVLLGVVVIYQVIDMGFVGDPFVESDMATYYNQSQSLFTSFTSEPIGFPIWLYCLFKVFGKDPEVAIWGNLALHLMTTFAGVLMLRFYFGIIASVVFLVGYGFCYEMIGLANHILVESLQAFCTIVGIWILSRIRATWSWQYVLLGLFFAWVAQVKSALLFIFLPMLLIVFCSLSNNLARVRQVLLIAVGFFPPLLAYGIYNYVNYDIFAVTATNGPVNFYSGNNTLAWGTEVLPRAPYPIQPSYMEYNQQFLDLGWKFRKEHPKRVKELNAIRIHNWWIRDSNQDGLLKLSRFNKDQRRERIFLTADVLIPLGQVATLLFFVFFTGRWVADRTGSIRALGVGALVVYLLSKAWLTESASNSVFFVLTLALSSWMFVVICASYWNTNLAGNEKSRLCFSGLPLGFMAFSAVYCLFFYIKVRYRSPMNLLHLFCVSVVFQSAILALVQAAKLAWGGLRFSNVLKMAEER